MLARQAVLYCPGQVGQGDRGLERQAGEMASLFRLGDGDNRTFFFNGSPPWVVLSDTRDLPNGRAQMGGPSLLLQQSGDNLAPHIIQLWRAVEPPAQVVF